MLNRCVRNIITRSAILGPCHEVDSRAMRTRRQGSFHPVCIHERHATFRATRVGCRALWGRTAISPPGCLGAFPDNLLSAANNSRGRLFQWTEAAFGARAPWRITAYHALFADWERCRSVGTIASALLTRDALCIRQLLKPKLGPAIHALDQASRWREPTRQGRAANLEGQKLSNLRIKSSFESFH